MTINELLALDRSPSDNLDLKCIAGTRGLDREIGDLSINRPGLALAGYFEQFDVEKVHVFGRGETGYLYMLEKKNTWGAINEIFKMGIPCSLFTNNLEPPQYFKDLSEHHNCAILKTSLPSAEFMVRFTRVISAHRDPAKIFHGVCVEVYGLGILLMGKSGVGKSESALALIERGHRLVADDSVLLRAVNGTSLIATVPKPEFGYHMEIRGIGIINIPVLFGIGSTIERKVIELALELVQWDDTKVYDRLGVHNDSTTILGVTIPKMVIPIKPGRSIPIIIETAAKNERLKQMGHHSAQEFSAMLKDYIQVRQEHTNG